MKNNFNNNKGQGLIDVILVLAIIIFAGGILYFSFFNPAKKSEVTKTSEFPQAINKSTEEPTKEETKPEKKITPPPQELPPPSVQKPPEKPITPIIQNKVPESNIVVIEDDGTLISYGVPSDRGKIDKSVSIIAVMKKFFHDYPSASSQYDFAFTFSTFNTPNTGQFTPTKKLDDGISDFSLPDIKTIQQETGLTGKEKLRGFAFSLIDVLDVDNFFSRYNNDMFLLIHEISHEWLFYLGDGGSCDKAFFCTKETGFKVRDWNLAHYGDKVKTTTKEGELTYVDPNSSGGGFVINPDAPGYCLDFGTGNPNGLKFTTLSLYLMGLIPPEQVIPLKWYETHGEWTDKGILCVEKTFSVQDIINLVGSRNPSYPNTQKDFSVVYILLTEKGKKPTDVQMRRMDYLAENFPIRWNEATNYKSTINGKGIIR